MVKKTVIAVNEDNALSMIPDIESVISVEDKGEEFHPPKWLKGKLNKSTVADMFDQVRMLLETGYSSINAFEMITLYGADSIRRVALLISDDLAKGTSLSESFHLHANDFGYDYSVQIQSAEKTATIPEVLASITNQLRTEVEVTQRTKKIIKPLLGRMLMILAMLVFMFMYVIPMLNEMFESLGTSQTSLVGRVVEFSLVINRHWKLVTIISVLVIGIVLLVVKYPLATWWDLKKIQFPFIGYILNSRDIISLYRFMGFALEADMSITQAFSISLGSIKNKAFKKELEKVKVVLESGTKPIFVALRGSKFISEVDRQTISMGYKTGNLGEQMLKMADVRERELKTRTEKLQEDMQPVVELVSSVILGAIGLLIYTMTMGAAVSI